MSSINVFATQEDITKVEDKITSAYETENITIISTRSANTVYEQFIINNKLDDPMCIIDVASIVEPSSTKYYINFQDAITDVNAGTYTHSTTDPTNAECILAVNADGINAIKVLKNITVSKSTQISAKLILDVNGYTLNFISGAYFNSSSELYIYAMKSNSYLSVVNRAVIVYGTRFYLLGGNINNDGTVATCPILIGVKTESRVVLQNAKIEINTNSPTAGGYLIGNGYSVPDNESEICINNCTIISNCSQCIKSYTKKYCFISNSYIENSPPDSSDNTPPAITFFGNDGVFCINNCTVKAANNAIDTFYSQNIYISNCNLSGIIHGGIYTGAYSKVYVKNSILNKAYMDGYSSQNYYSCYCGYDSKTYFDNCKFTSYDNQHNIPAIKTGDSGTITFRHTQAYFSNCELDSIRVDQYCRAYLGLGISDTLKQQSVSGQIIDTGNACYGYELTFTAPQDKFFYCTYGTTTYNEIVTALDAGKIPICVYDNGSNLKGTYNLYSKTSSTCIFTKSYNNTTYYIAVNTSNTWSNNSTSMEIPYQGRYNNRRTVGANELGRTLICAEDKDGRITPMVLGNTTAATKTACTVPFRPQSIYYFSGTSAMSAGAVVNAGLFYEYMYITTTNYTFNGSMPGYRIAYLVGTYDKTTGLFTLDSTSTTSYYVFVPNNTASITLSDYFTAGKYYIRIGESTATENQMQIEMHKPMYYFDGTNLVDGYTASGVTDVQINGTSIVENGVASIPIASPTQLGLVKPAGSSYGIAYQTSGNICTASATNSDIEVRTNEYKPITPSNLKYAVDSVLCSTSASEALTSQQKANAKARLGISDSEKFELIEEVSIVSGITEIDKYTEPDGTAYNFKAVRVYLDKVLPDSTSSSRLLYMRMYNGDNDIIGGAYHDVWHSKPYAILDVFDNKGFWESQLHTGVSAGAWNGTYAISTLNLRMSEVNSNYIKHINFKAATDGSSFASGTIKIYAIRA